MELLGKIVEVTARQYTNQRGEQGIAHQIEMSTDAGRVGFEVFRLSDEEMVQRGLVKDAIGTIEATLECRRYTDKNGVQRITTNVNFETFSWRLANKGLQTQAPAAQAAPEAVAVAQAAPAQAQQAAAAGETDLPF